MSDFPGTAALTTLLEPALADIGGQLAAALGYLVELLASLVFFTIPVFDTRLPFIVLWLASAAVFATFYFKFINLHGLRHAIRIVRGDFSHPDDKGEISHLQALTTAISGTVGIGNIGGVAFAISLGGPGVVFWMAVAGFLGMSVKFVECTLATYFRRSNADSSVSGGPMFYLRRGLGESGWPKTGRFLGAFYALGILIGCLGIGNMFQSHQAFTQFVVATGGPEASWFADKGWLFGLCLAVAIGLVTLGGIRWIARVTVRIVPFMALLYCAMALLVIAMNIQAVPFAITAIVRGAFTAEGAAGGALGALIIGFQRAVFSHEAGIGSAAIAHSAVRTLHPVTQGYVSLLEPFIDTVIISTLTGLVIVTTLYYEPGLTSGIGGIEMTSFAFERNLAWAALPLALAALLFAFSTALAWSYYGLKGWTYLFGEGRRGAGAFKLVFCAFTVLGAMTPLQPLIAFSDALVFLISVPNVIGLYWLAPLVKRELRIYRVMLRSGEVVDYREERKLAEAPRPRK